MNNKNNTPAALANAELYVKWTKAFMAFTMQVESSYQTQNKGFTEETLDLIRASMGAELRGAGTLVYEVQPNSPDKNYPTVAVIGFVPNDSTPVYHLDGSVYRGRFTCYLRDCSIFHKRFSTIMDHDGPTMLHNLGNILAEGYGSGNI